MARNPKNATRRAILRARQAHRHRVAARESQTNGQGTAPTAQVTVRRRRHQDNQFRKLKKSVKLLTTVLQDYKKCKYRVALAMDELRDAKTQIQQLNSAVNFLLKYPPHSGSYFSEYWGCWAEWTRIR
ncbi:21e05104-e84c-42d9-b69e-0abb99fe67a6 [Thermothielavioides terrestris]|uniref:21e05104-e84c-42d9-b69e-0abb99fe67a6 n=1 Tax=Thermothielavioides terrestris TaxID=2587410 RepID=A0A3S4F2L8_9PEZI|nr:21e05104-e84c-42d9-b69e-0abb99fe67a6 [Thermothielavioides terrestris]